MNSDVIVAISKIVSRYFHSVDRFSRREAQKIQVPFLVFYGRPTSFIFSKLLAGLFVVEYY